MNKILKNRYILATIATSFLVVAILSIMTIKENRDYDIAIGYLRMIGITERDLKGYSKKEIIKAANKYEEEIHSGKFTDLLAEKESIKAIYSEDIKELSATMTYKEVVEKLGPTRDVGHSRYILEYRVDDIYSLKLTYGNDQEKLGISGEELLEQLELIE